MHKHKDESARDTTLFRRFLTKTTSTAKTLAHALTGAPDFPFGSNSRIASHPAPYCLAPPDSSLNKQKNATYSYQSFSYIDIISKNNNFVNRFDKKRRQPKSRLSSKKPIQLTIILQQLINSIHFYFRSPNAASNSSWSKLFCRIVRTEIVLVGLYHLLRCSTHTTFCAQTKLFEPFFSVFARKNLDF